MFSFGVKFHNLFKSLVIQNVMKSVEYISVDCACQASIKTVSNIDQIITTHVWAKMFKQSFLSTRSGLISVFLEIRKINHIKIKISLFAHLHNYCIHTLEDGEQQKHVSIWPEHAADIPEQT